MNVDQYYCMKSVTFDNGSFAYRLGINGVTRIELHPSKMLFKIVYEDNDVFFVHGYPFVANVGGKHD